VAAGADARPGTGPDRRLNDARIAEGGSLAAVPSYRARTFTLMPLCFIEPQEAIRVIADAVGREARRQLLGEVVRAWVDEIPEDELAVHYAKAVEVLDDDDLSMLAAWHASLEVGKPIANKDFLLKAFGHLGEHRREALRIAAGFRGDEAFEAGISEEQAIDTVLPFLSHERMTELADEAIELYCWDRMGSDN
jgi:hypothetical protein